jgi:hypothetical protein
VQCANNCNDDDKGGALRIQSGFSTALLIDVIFAANLGNGAGNIFSTSSSAKLYLMNMPITEIGGITPIIKCDPPPTTTDFSSEDYTIGTTYAFVKGNAFNIVNVPRCGLISTTTINGGETLRVRGTNNLDHPNLMRGGHNPNNIRGTFDYNGGQAGGDQVKVRAHHFVLNGDSVLTLMNLKLSGAFSGHVAIGNSCGCTRYGVPPYGTTCGVYPVFGYCQNVSSF